MKTGVLKEIQDKLAASEAVLQAMNTNAPTVTAMGNGESYLDKTVRAPDPLKCSTRR